MSPLKGHKMDELLTMSNRELTRLEVIQRIQAKRLTQKEAAHMLNLRDCLRIRQM
jgi:hypothetical protein